MEKGFFGDVIKLRIILDYLGVAKYNHKCPCERQTEGDLTEEEKAMLPQGQSLEWCGHKPTNAGIHKKLVGHGWDSPLEYLEEEGTCWP